MVFEIDETKSWNENYNIFLESQKDADYNLGDFTGTIDGDMQMYTDLKIKSQQETKKINDFNIKKNIAFQELYIQQDEEKIALGRLWQEYEDNNYIIE